MISKWLSKAGSRFLFGMAIFACSFLFITSENLTVGFIGFFLFVYGFYTAVSVVDVVRCKYMNKYTVLIGEGMEMQYILVQAKYHAYLPAPIFQWCCPHYYIAYKKEFFLVPVEEQIELQPGTKISDEILHYNGAILLSDADYAGLMRDAQATLQRLVMR